MKKLESFETQLTGKRVLFSGTLFTHSERVRGRERVDNDDKKRERAR